MSVRREIYLDHNATTPTLPAVREAVLRALGEDFANPSSAHAGGERARRLVDSAREAVAALLGARPTEIVFTSCATESTNAALRSAWLAAGRKPGAKIAITAVEHEATIETARALAAEGAQTVVLPVDAEGRLDLARAAELLTPDVFACAAMWANNETGVVLPVAELGALCRARGIAFHVDAVQTVGKLALDVEALGCDFLSLSAHKFHGPKGVGVLYVRRGARYRRFVQGGPQEGGRRGGTENVPGIAGLGAAAAHMAQGIPARRAHLAALSARVERALLAAPETKLNGAVDGRLPGVSNVSFRGVEGASIVVTAAREGVCISAGSACSASALAGSHVLEAMGLSYAWLHGAIRVSCAETTTPEDVDQGVATILRAAASLRALDPERAARRA
jgi:cysteine desulfurase